MPGIRYVWQKLVGSPESRISVGVAGNVVTGALCSAFITEITKDGRLVWASFYTTLSFYLLMAASVFLSLFGRATYLREKDIEKFSDDVYCRAYVRSQLLPEVIRES